MLEDVDIYLVLVPPLCLPIILIYRRDVPLDICGGALVLMNAAERVAKLVDSGARELSIVGPVVEPAKVHRGHMAGDVIVLRSNVGPRSTWIEAHADVGSSTIDENKTDVGVVIPSKSVLLDLVPHVLAATEERNTQSCTILPQGRVGQSKTPLARFRVGLRPVAGWERYVGVGG